MKRSLLTLSILTSATLLTACGSGSSTESSSTSDAATNNTTTSTPSAAKSTYALKGTVPGTLIEAYCDNGGYFATHSTQNGTNQHPFELSLPAGLSCNLVMTTNETDPANSVITAIGFRDDNGNIGTRVTATANTTIDIGNVALFTSRTDASAADLDGNGVIDSPFDIGNHPDLSISQSINTALDMDGNGIIEPYEDEDGDGIINRDDADYSKKDIDTDRDGLMDSIDVNKNNDPNASNTYPTTIDSDQDGYLDEDLNHDGFYDDDKNHDGFHDDDANHDGFHDDDLNRDGHHDSENHADNHSGGQDNH